MQCEHVQRELVAYHHGTLAQQERATIDTHLSTCEACAEEATAMRRMGNLLSKGLKDWVDQGVCPPDVAAQIEMRLHSVRQRPWWQRWPAMVGVAASVAAVFIVLLASQPQLAQQMASVPLFGALAAQLADPDLEIQTDPQRPVTAALFRPTRTVDLVARTESSGVELTVDRVATDSKLLRVQYTLKGGDLVLPAEKLLTVPKLSGSTGPVQLHGLTADRRGEEIRFVAYFEAVREGEKLTMTAPALETAAGERKGPWSVDFTN